MFNIYLRSSLAVTSGALTLLCALPGAGHAQTDVEELGRAHGGAKPPPRYYEILRQDPTAYQFSRDNGWIRRGLAVATSRNAWRARAAAADQLLFSPFADFNDAGIMRGDLNVPAFLILYANTDSAGLVANVPREALESRLYGSDPAPPYSIHTYYREISNDSLLVNGTVLDWARVSQADTYYEAGCNGLCARTQFVSMVQDLVAAHDDTVDFGQFDNDGPDGVPNSGDDDGYVDAIVLIHPEVDGSCMAVNTAAANNIWAHRWTLLSPVSTGDTAQASGVTLIRLRDYIIQGGQGGDSGCNDNEPQAMGVVAHETGHIFGLPDLYDTRSAGGGQGIGHWGLMGSGNWRRPFSPAHMEAWSRAQLGWVTEVLVTDDTALEVGPIETTDTAYVVPITGSSEYFLLENRQPIGSDAQMHGPGLLIWHVDSALVLGRWAFNQVNSLFPYGVALEQADGRTDLQATSGGNRGDPGDPFPGSTGNAAFGMATTPNSNRNNGTPSYVSIDSIGTVAGTSNVRFRVRLRPLIVMASDTAASVQVDGVTHSVFRALVEPGQQLEVTVDSIQSVSDGRKRLTWTAWSNGQPRSHTLSATPGDSVIAQVDAEFLLQVQVAGSGGSVASAPVLDLSTGEFVREDSLVTLVATVGQAGHLFEGWSGDTTSASDTLELVMTRPFSLTATFAAPLVVAAGEPDTAIMGAQYQYQLVATGGIEEQVWSVTDGALPGGVTLAPNGLLSGRPEETGAFPFTAQVASGSQTESRVFQFRVAAPALATGDVVAQVTGTGTPLSGSEIAYLDLLGNKNGQADVGDFFAWVQATGAAAGPEVIAEVLRSRREVKP